MKKPPTITREDGRYFLIDRIRIDELLGADGDGEIGIYLTPVGKIGQ